MPLDATPVNFVVRIPGLWDRRHLEMKNLPDCTGSTEISDLMYKRALPGSRNPARWFALVLAELSGEETRP